VVALFARREYLGRLDAAIPANLKRDWLGRNFGDSRAQYAQVMKVSASSLEPHDSDGPSDDRVEPTVERAARLGCVSQERCGAEIVEKLHESETACVDRTAISEKRVEWVDGEASRSLRAEQVPQIGEHTFTRIAGDSG